MKTTAITLILAITLFLTSCNFNFPDKISGKGEILTEQIMLEPFDELQLERGWDVILEPSDSNYMIIEANENLFEVFEYNNKDGRLKVSALKQISGADSKQITIYFSEDLSRLRASSGTEVDSPEVLRFNQLALDVSSGADVDLALELSALDLETSSGSNVRLKLDADDVSVDSSSGSSAEITVETITAKADASSGSNINLEGTSNEFNTTASSGASIDSKALISKNVTAKASSGSSISVYPVDYLSAGSSSGGNVYYYNKPSGELDINKSKSGGAIKQKS